jgi:16S rRNA (adenine1518-N6/adenine1519-N6)-dimethyltransferase
VRPDEIVVEIGPGTGILTSRLIKYAGQIIAVEIDQRLVTDLRRRFQGIPHLRVVQGDILQYDWERLIAEYGDRRLVVLGNIPYQITSPVLEMLFSYRTRIDRAILTVQREVAHRITAAAGRRTYGVLSIAAQVYSQPESLFDIHRRCFRPVPRVDSCLIRLTFPPLARIVVSREEAFFRVVRGVFTHRRKMLKNALALIGSAPSNADYDAIAEKTGIDLRRRPETLTIEEFDRLSQAVDTMQNAECKM